MAVLSIIARCLEALA